MKEWLTTLGICVFFISLISLFLVGKTSNTVKFVCGIIIIILIFSPLLNLEVLDLQVGIQDIENELYVDENILNSLANKRVSFIKKRCDEIIEKKGIEGQNIEIDYTVDEVGGVNIKKITVNLINSVIDKNIEHIVISEEIKKEIANTFNINENSVIING